MIARVSVGNQVTLPNAAVYGMCKAAITHLGASLAAELTEDRINVNVICPGWIDTPGERKFCPEEEIQRLGALLPWGRIGTPDDIGNTCSFLCSAAADYITGSTINVDGGYTVGLRLPALMLPPKASERADYEDEDAAPAKRRKT